MKKFWVLFSLFVLGLLAGPAMALTVQNTMIDWHIFNGDSASSIYTIADEPSDFSDVTLFCPMDALDVTNNVTTCYQNGSLVNLTLTGTDTGLPALVSGKIGNAFQFEDGDKYILLNKHYSTTEYYISAWIRTDTYPSDEGGSAAYAFAVYLYNSTGDLIAHFKPYYIQRTGKIWYLVWSNTEGKVVTSGVVFDNYDTNWHFYEVAVRISGATVTFTFYVDLREINSVTYTFPQQVATIGLKQIHRTAIGDYFKYTIDEVREYTRIPSDDERKLLYLAGRKKLSEPANLTVSSVTYDSTANKFDITINASLPAGAQYLYVPADAIVSAPVVQNWSTGHKLIDVSGKNSVLITIPATVGATVPGLRGLAIETDEGIYAYGTGKLNLATPLSTPLAKPSLITNTIQDGKVVAINWSGIDTFSKLQPSAYITSTSGSANLTILQDSDKLMKLNLDAPLKLYFQNLLPIMTYDVSNGQDKIGSFKTDTLGTASYTAPAGTIYIGTPENIQQVMSNNLINLLTKILIIALMAGVFVEMTKTKMDDEMVAAIIALLVVLVIIAIIHYL